MRILDWFSSRSVNWWVSTYSFHDSGCVNQPALSHSLPKLLIQEREWLQVPDVARGVVVTSRIGCKIEYDDATMVTEMMMMLVEE